MVDSGELFYSDGGYYYIADAYEDGTALYNSKGELFLEDISGVLVDEANGSIVAKSLNDGKYRSYDAEGNEIAVYEDAEVWAARSDVVVVSDNGYENATLVQGTRVLSDTHDVLYDMENIGICDIYMMADYDDDGNMIYTTYVLAPAAYLFYDSYPEHWSYPYIHAVYEIGIMKGIGGNMFGTVNKSSRAQLVTIIWRLAGEPESDSDEMNFTDVPESKWYTEAVKWAADEGIVNGVGGELFAPDRTITRGEVAAIFYRFAEYMDLDTTARADVSEFADTDELTDWNRDAFAWCVAMGIINGKEISPEKPCKLAPDDVITRAELAAIICRFEVE